MYALKMFLYANQTNILFFEVFSSVFKIYMSLLQSNINHLISNRIPNTHRNLCQIFDHIIQHPLFVVECGWA
jgi:hypothetical protein